MFAGNFAPVGWEFCNGQILPISENETLFQLIGTTYGGDGEWSFALPNLQSRIPIHMGTGPDGTPYQLAEMAGVEEVTLSTQQIPVHTHPLIASTTPATSGYPQGRVLAQPRPNSDHFREPASDGLVPMAANSLAPSGGSQPHSNVQPFLCVNFIISLFGIFPSQT